VAQGSTVQKLSGSLAEGGALGEAAEDGGRGALDESISLEGRMACSLPCYTSYSDCWRGGGVWWQGLCIYEALSLEVCHAFQIADRLAA
jgi:hypothetical protein